MFSAPCAETMDCKVSFINCKVSSASVEEALTANARSMSSFASGSETVRRNVLFCH